jgi:hypothetical protein
MRPSDLNFLRPMGQHYWLSNSEDVDLIGDQPESVVEITELDMSTNADCMRLQDTLGELALRLRNNKDVMTFLPLERKDGLSKRITLVERYRSVQAKQSILEQTRRLRLVALTRSCGYVTLTAFQGPSEGCR